jgi:hypothetical protein
LGKVPNSAGTGPLKSLSKRFKFSNNVKLPTNGLNLPENLLVYKESDFNDFNS